tara:strand:- start:351 stop:488 length:138 start_codon:yes stop_codon:yes gene_type:complete
MEQGLAHQMTYGSGDSQTIKHHYDGTVSPKKAKKAVKGKKKHCKK